MTQNTNLNISPYFDDFTESKNYNKVLFKPGFPVQARELTTLQTILQNQIERFGQYFFKEGSIVIPGGNTYDSQYFAVRIDPTYLTLPVNAYTQVLVDNNIKIKGESSGVTATVVNRLTAVESVDNFDTLYVKYTGSGTDGETKAFQDGENLITLGDINYSSTKIEANSTFASCINTGATKIGSSASILEGIYFIRGYFVQVPTTTIILDQYTNNPSYKIGLTVKEEIVTASSVNTDLYDNAQGFSNDSAPGADRFALSAVLSKKLLTDQDDKNFIELIRIENGVLAKFEDTNPEFNYFANELARRTYDESGDYYVRPFSVESKESLNDRISNRGLYFENQTTQNGSVPTDGILCLSVSPGKAYVRGFEIKKDFTSAIDVVKPRTTKKRENVTVPVKIGNVVSVNNTYGSPKIGFDNSTAHAVSLLDRKLIVDATGVVDAAAEVVGKARVYDWEETNTSGDNYRYDLRLYDIQTYTKLTTGQNLTTVTDDYVEGKYSGASGHVVTGITNSTSIALQDVKGVFQKNEPLLLNGVEVGRNVGVSTDYDFSDVKAIHKAVGVSTFAADVNLTYSRNIANPGVEWTITGGSDGTTGFSTVSSGQVPDVRGYVKVGDMVRYSTEEVNSADLPTIVQISAIGVGGTCFEVRNTANIAGVSTGLLSTGNKTPTGLEVVVPTLDQSSNSDIGLRLPFNNSYVASANLLDSSYIFRKQFDAQSTAAGVLTFTIGINDVFFEPFSVDTYILTRAGASGGASGDRILLRSDQVTISGDSLTCTINGMTASKDFTLTAAVKRTKLSSVEKSITRCSSLIVRKSTNSGSGIGTNNYNDGLNVDASGSAISASNTRGYGLRVQDREISLNVPDVHRVLAVLESNDTNDPQVPSITVANATDVFDSNNVVIGEQFIGNNSGALGRVVRVVSSNQLEFVYENKKIFEIDEQVTLKTSGIFGTINTLLEGDRNIIDNFDVDFGHRPEFADYSRLIRKKDAPVPTRKLRVIFDYFTNIEASGSVESVSSYSKLDYTNEVPFIIDRRASDFIDLRPRVAAHTGHDSPFSFNNRVFTGTAKEPLVSNQSIVVDYNHYLGRVDRLYLTKDGLFEIKKGEPSLNPKVPVRNEEAFEVAWVSMDPYVLNASDNVKIKLTPHKRYTMKDIGGLEHRIKNLENYTTLSLLETDTKNLAIKDPNTGLDKFKSGFFVDNFRNHASHSLEGESQFDIDIQRSEGRPRTTERNAALVFETKTSRLDPLSTDYRFTSDFDSPDISRKGPALTLAYTNEVFINQPLATRVENLNPFSLTTFVGTLELNPSTDFWIDEIVAAPQTINFGDGIFDSIAQIMGVDDRENGGMASGMFNTTEQTWGDREWIGEERINSEVIDQEVDVERGQRGRTNWRRRTTTTTTTSNDFLHSFNQTGIEKTFGLELSSHTENIDLGPKVTSMEVLYNCRSRNVEVIGTRLKPNTRYYVFMENVDVTEWCVPKMIPVTMDRGSFTAGDIITSPRSWSTLDHPTITFRAAQANHRFGAFNNPNETYSTEPYNNTALTSSYSGTSNTINVDTFDLGDQRTIERLGFLKKNMQLSNQQGTAEATVADFSIRSDEFGNCIFSLHIPDPTNPSNPKFSTGQNTIRVTTSPTNESILDPGEASAQTIYLASGSAMNTVEQTLAIKTPQVERKQIGNDEVISRIVTEVEQDRIETQTIVREEGGWGDPLAQSFIVARDAYNDGVFITSGEVYFKSKDDDSNVTVQIRELDEGGRPSSTILPYAETTITPGSAGISTDSSVGTGFTFSSPVYLKSDGRYALTLITPSIGWNTFITKMNEPDLITGRLNDKQPTLGSLFKSQNSQLWTASQFEDLKFKLYKAKFVTNKPASVVLYNHDLPSGRIRKQNAATAYSKRQTISIGSTDRTYAVGNKIEQTNSGVLTKGFVYQSGGPIVASSSGLTYVANSGIGLTPASGTVDYANVTFTTLSGIGANAQATVRITDGEVNTITVSNGGNGYAVGDLLLMNPVGLTGSGVRVIVNSLATLHTDRVIIDDVNGDFKTGVAYTHYNSSGDHDINHTEITASAVNTDSIRDGKTIGFDHKNHGMHSSTNKVKVEDFVSDLAPIKLEQKIDDDTTAIKVTDASIFVNFERSPVSATNLGYIKIDNEIISYEGANTSTNELTSIVRQVDNSLKTNHAADSRVYKYEFSGVSLRNINKTHNISDKAKTFDTYYVGIATDKMFEATRSGGGQSLKVSQNIPFEAVNPKLTTITPTGTNISARVKTTSGTSISGSEISFLDKGYEVVSLNKFNQFDSPRLIASKTNEYELMSDEKSFALELTLRTTKEDLSPVVDLSTANVILHSNLIDSPVSDFSTDSRPKIPGLDPHSAIYETKRVDLEFSSNSLYVQFDGHRETSGQFRVFYKLYRNDSQDAGQDWILFNSTGLPDKTVVANKRPNTFSEYKYTAENTPQFNGFVIKVVMTSDNQAQAPRLKNFRAIALRSFDI